MQSRVRSSDLGRALLVVLAFVGPSLGLAGCSFTYTDQAGNRHVTGLVLDLTVKASPERDTIAGDVLEVTTVGLSVGQTASGGYVTAGYNREVSADLRNNALVIGNPLNAFAGEPARAAK